MITQVYLQFMHYHVHVLKQGMRQQYRVCHNGNCPIGAASEDPDVHVYFDIEKSTKCIENSLKVTLEEMKTFAHVCGHHDIHDFSIEDMVTTNCEINEYTKILHA